MSFKPGEAEWMGYLYHELDAETTSKMDALIQSDPEAAREWQRWQKLRAVTGLLEDKEVIAPVFYQQEPQRKTRTIPGIYKVLTGIAASLLILMVAAKFLDLHISYSKNELSISFGPAPVAEPIIKQADPGITAEQIQQLIDESLAKNSAGIEAKLKETRQALKQELAANDKTDAEQMNQLVTGSAQINEAQIRQFVSSLQTENLKLIKDYMKMSAKEQNNYMEGLLVDFSKYVQEQRRGDLQLVETRLNSIEKNTSVFRQETEQILTSILGGKNKDKEVKY